MKIIAPILVSSALVIPAAIAPNAFAQSMTECIMAHSSGSLSPACAKMLGLQTNNDNQSGGSLLGNPPANDSGLPIKQTITYQPQQNAVGNASILGLKLGMSAHDAAEFMANYCHKKPDVDYQYLSSSYKGMTEQTRSYVGQLKCETNGNDQQQDSLTVDMSPPSAGNFVEHISRKVFYISPEKAPEYKILSDDLSKKYGLNIIKKFLQGNGVIHTKKNGEVLNNKAFEMSCPSVSDYSLNPNTQIALCSKLSIDDANEDRVRIFEISIEDIGAELDQQQEVLKQINADIDQKLSSNKVEPNL